jgi:type II secretory pathway predicted ATPase ExeA
MNPVVTEFFYEGANRGEIFDSLVYVLTHGEDAEGIITVTGEPGSGKSTLCGLVMKRLPKHLKTIYIAQPAADSAELFNSVARKLDLGLAGASEKVEVDNDTSAIIRLQNILEQKHDAGLRVVLIIDEAQRLAAEMLDELGTLYELELSRHKLLQMVLVGQNELEHTLASPSLDKLKHLVAHRFHLNPLGPVQVEEYLRLCARTSSNRGVARLSTPRAIKLIGMASGGGIERLNMLAGKSSAVAALENAPDITEEHVRKAIDESGIKYPFNAWSWSKWYSPVNLRHGASIVASIMMLALVGWLGLRAPSPAVSSVSGLAAVVVATTPLPPNPSSLSTTASAPNPPSQALTTGPTSQTAQGAAAKSPAGNPLATAAVQQGSDKLNIAGVKLTGFKLLEQRVESTIKTMETVNGNQYTIQLFSTENIQPDRMERFLIRARNLVDLSNLYVHIVKNGDKAKFRVTYGAYPSRDDAAAAITQLPEKYQSAFHPELFTFADFR